MEETTKMTLLQALDIWGKVTKQRLPIAHNLKEMRDRPAIYGGGTEIVCHAAVSYCSGDYSTWPVKVKSHVIGTEKKRIDPVEFAAEAHYGHKADKDAHLPCGAVRQRRAREPKRDGQRKVPAEIVAIHAHVSGVLEKESIPHDIFLIILQWFPRDKDDPLHTYCNHKDCARARKWFEENGIAKKTGYTGRAQKQS